MDHRLLEAVMDGIAPVIKEHVASVVRPLQERIAELEARGYAGVHEDGREYSKGQFVTSKGSVWHANVTTRQRPGENGAWTLAVKCGRDGKDAPR